MYNFVINFFPLILKTEVTFINPSENNKGNATSFLNFHFNIYFVTFLFVIMSKIN